MPDPGTAKKNSLKARVECTRKDSECMHNAQRQWESVPYHQKTWFYHVKIWVWGQRALPFQGADGATFSATQGRAEMLVPVCRGKAQQTLPDNSYLASFNTHLK